MPYNTQEKSEAILRSIDELFSDVKYGIFFVEFHFLMHNPGLTNNQSLLSYISKSIAKIIA